MSLILTKAGLDAYAQSEASGVKLQATHMAVGDGGGAPVAHTDTSEGLINETWRGELQGIDVAASGEVEFTGHVPITVGGWWIREIAIYADDTLLALSSHPETWKPAPEAPDKVELVITAPVMFANADNINLTVDTTKVLASQTYVLGRIETHDSDPDAHADMVGGFARLDTVQTWTAQQYFERVPLNFAASIPWALDAKQVAGVTLTDDAELANPTGQHDGGVYRIMITQDATGGHELTFGAAYDADTLPTINTEPNAVTLLAFESDGATMRCVWSVGAAAAGAPASVGVTGVIEPFAGETAPDGALICDGSLLDRTLFADLFAILGERYGAGDGVTTFAVPDLRDEFIRGLDTSTGRTLGSHQDHAQEAITGWVRPSASETGAMTINALDGSLFSWGISSNISATFGTVVGGETVASQRVLFDSSAVVNTADENRPDNTAMHYIIWY